MTFITYTTNGNSLTAEKAFVSLSLFNLLRFPLAMLPMMITSIVEASVAVKRLRDFLLLGEKDANNVSKDAMMLHSNYLADASTSTHTSALAVENGTFGWSQTSKALFDINFVAQEKSLTAVVGRVGSGKSSFIAALLGDMVKYQGKVVVPGSVAYVPQQAWIRNATVRDNITFGRRFDQQKYDQIIHACALAPDLKILPGGDHCEIGERGVNLSGGQVCILFMVNIQMARLESACQFSSSCLSGC